MGRSTRIIHVDSTRADVDNFYSPAVEVLGDIAASLTGLTGLVSRLVLAPDVERFLSTLASKRASGLPRQSQTVRKHSRASAELGSANPIAI